MTNKTICQIFGAVFILVGLLGFMPNPVVSADGIFVVNGIHNLVHLLTGGAFLLGAVMFPGQERRTIQIIGTAYLAVAILGFLTKGNVLLGLIDINQADRWLHLGLALVILISGTVMNRYGEASLSRI